MVNYICDRCLVDFGNKKIKYERHINRKYPCKKINNSLQGGDELENVNKKDIILEVINKQNEKIDFLIKQNEILQEDVKNLKKDNEIFKNQIILFNSGSKNIKNTINNTNNTNYTLNIQINNFKDTKYLTENCNKYFCNRFIYCVPFSLFIDFLFKKQYNSNNVGLPISLILSNVSSSEISSLSSNFRNTGILLKGFL